MKELTEEACSQESMCWMNSILERKKKTHPGTCHPAGLGSRNGRAWRTGRFVALVFLHIAISGCATTISVVSSIDNGEPPGIYGGTEMDIIVIYLGAKTMGTPLDCGALNVLAVVGGLVDLPFSFVADTVLLPLTIPWNLLATP